MRTYLKNYNDNIYVVLIFETSSLFLKNLPQIVCARVPFMDI